MTGRFSLVGAAVLSLARPAAAQAVDDLWANHCAKCHGDRGQGGGEGTPSLFLKDWHLGAADRDLFNTVKKGDMARGMPGFGETLSDPQIWALVNYSHELHERDRRARTPATKPDAATLTSQHHAYRIETVVDKDLDVPWALDFAPGGRMLITNRSGAVLVHSTGKPGGELSRPVAGTPAVRDRGQGGLMEVALHPKFAENGWVYLAYAEGLKGGGDSGDGMTTIARGKIAGLDSREPKWTDPQVIFRAKDEHFLATDYHFGSRIAFDPKDPSLMYFAIGERGRMEMAQDLARPNGKVHRIRDDGGIPADNPFADDTSKSKGIYPSIWSYGHRNPQGLVFDLEGRLWDTEHGPRGGDELNLVLKGRNYGWPVVSFGINYNGTPFATPWPTSEASPLGEGPDGAIVMPVFCWLPSIGVCGLDVARGEAFPRWSGDLLAGGLSGANVDRLRVKDGKLIERETLVYGIGRVRDVSVAPDGTIYVALNDPHKIVRLVPADAK